MAKSKLKKLQRLFFRAVISIILGILGLAILFGIYLTTTPGENLIRSIAKTELEKALNQTVEIRKLQTDLLSHVELEGVSIYQTRNDSVIPSVELKELEVKYSLLNLALMNLNIRSLAIEGLQVYLLKDSSGFYNLPAFASTPEDTTTPPDERTPMSITLDEFRLRQGAIHYSDRTMPLSGSLRNLDIKAGGEFLKDFEFDIKTHANQLSYEDKEISIDTMAVEGQWIDQSVKVNTLVMTFPGYKLTGTAEVNLEENLPTLSANLKLSGSPEPLSRIFREQIPQQLFPVEGDINLSFEISGNIEEPRIGTQIEFSKLALSGMLLNRGNIKAVWYNDSVEIEHMSMDVMKGKIDGSGRVVFGEVLDHSLNLTVSGIDMQRAWQEIYQERSPYQGKINGQVISSGPLEDLDSIQLSSNLSIQNVSFQQKPLPDFIVSAELTGGRANLDIHQAESRIAADVRLFDEKLSGNFSINIRRLEPFAGLANLMGLKGSLNLDGSVSGTMDSPELKVGFNADSLRYQNLPMDTLYGSFTYRDNQLRVQECLFNGSLEIIDSTIAPFDLSNLKGGLTYRGKVEGTLEDPQAKLEVSFQDADYAGYQIKGLMAQVSLSGDTLLVKRIRVDRDSLIALASGIYDLNKAQGEITGGLFEIDDELKLLRGDHEILSIIDLSDSSRWKIDVRGNKIELDKLAGLLPTAVDVTGNLNFKLSFNGTPDRPNANLTLAIQNPRFEEVAMDSVTAKMRLNPNYVYLDLLELVVQGNKSWIEGNLQLRKTSEGYSFAERNAIDISAQGDDIDLRILNPFLSPGMQVAGVSSYRVDVSGNLAKPRIDGEFDISAGEFRISEDTPPVTAINVELVAQDSAVNIGKFSGKIKEKPFNLKGKIIVGEDLSLTSNIDLSISNRTVLQASGTIAKEDLDFNLGVNQLDLSLLQPFVEEVRELNGITNSNFRIAGSFSKPTMNGNLNIRKLSFKPQAVDALITGGVVKLTLQGNQARLDSLYMQINDGYLIGSGNIVISGEEFSQLNLTTQIKNVKIESPDFLLTMNNAQISYKKQNGNYSLNGDIVLGESKLLYNVKPSAILPFAKKVEQPEAEAGPLMQKTQIKVRLHDSKNVWVDNNLARIQLRPEVEFIGTLAHPNISGRVSVEEGYVLYLDRKFQIERGTIDFVDPNRLNPIVDLLAVTNVTSYNRLEGTPYDINFQIYGPLDEIKVELTSDPPLERADIVALLTVGATRTQLTGKSTGGEQVTTSEILEQRFQTLSTRIISGYAGKRLENLLGLQEVSVRGNLFNRASGPQLVASKRISNNAKLTYTTTVGHLNEQGIRLDYTLSKRFSVEGQTDQQGESSLSLKYKLRFK